MINAVDVRPGKWSNMIVLYDNGIYSAIWGSYENSQRRRLGVRWNGDTERSVGFPSTRGKPQWHLEPSMFILPMLNQLSSQLVEDHLKGSLSMFDYVKRSKAVLKAIEEFHSDVVEAERRKQVCDTKVPSKS